MRSVLVGVILGSSLRWAEAHKTVDTVAEEKLQPHLNPYVVKAIPGAHIGSLIAIYF
jgi:hypothetical protein